MAVFRIHKSNDFTVMSRHHLRNKELSLKAKGLLTLMLSLPEDWDYSILGLASLSKDGKDSVMSALGELTSSGYVEMDSRRNEKGQYETLYNVYEFPNRESRCGKSESENPPQYNINNVSIDTENVNNEDNYSSSRTINSTSKNNNISSPKKEKKGLDLSFVGVEYMQAFGEWLEYKRKRGDMYQTQRGVQAGYRELLTACNNRPEFALAVVNYSIDKEYKGIFPSRELKQQIYGNSSTTTQQPAGGRCMAAQIADAWKASGAIL